MIKVDNLTVNFGPSVAVREVSRRLTRRAFVSVAASSYPVLRERFSAPGTGRSTMLSLIGSPSAGAARARCR